MKSRILARFIGLTSCLFFISGFAFLTTAFSQGHAGHSIQSMRQENTETVKSEDLQPAAQKEPAQEIPQVEITPDQQQLIGVKTVKVSLNPFKKIIRTLGRVEVDERRQATINAKIEGWIEKLYVDYTGAYVKKGDPMAEIYSPELLAAQLEFLNALKWSGRKTIISPISDAGHEGHDNTSPAVESESELQRMLNEDAAETVDAARERLRLWDMSEAQIAKVEETGKPLRTVTLYSPAGGYVTEKMAVLGMKIMPGEKLFDVADFSTLWIIADIYEYDLPYIKAGQEAKITLSYVAEKEMSSRIDYIYPVISGDTRTAKVRLSVSNPNGQLKAQMYTNIEISIDLGKRVTIPESAVIDTGEKQVVYVDLGGGAFEPREVLLGLRTDGYAEVLKGLQEGESVSTSANFLIDSEAQLKGIKPLSGK